MGGEHVPAYDVGLVLFGMVLSFLAAMLKDFILPLIQRQKPSEPERRDSFGRRELDDELVRSLESRLLDRLNGKYVRRDLYDAELTHTNDNIEALRARTEIIGNREHDLREKFNRRAGKAERSES